MLVIHNIMLFLMYLSPKVICLGEALVDRLGPLGCDPLSASLDDCDDRLGGAPANVAIALSRLGTPSAFVGRLGRDSIGDLFEKLFISHDVSLMGFQRDLGRPSRVVLVRRHMDGERVFEGFVGDDGLGFSDQALDLVELHAVWSSLTAQADWLLLGTIPLASSASCECLLWALSEANRVGIKIALDVNWRPTFWDPSSDPASGPCPKALQAMQPIVDVASLIKLAREEALWLFGSSDPRVISNSLPNSPDVVVTNGCHPIHWYLSGTFGVLNALAPPQVIDTTGAGDAFTAALLHQLVASPSYSRSPCEIVRFAAASGALVCGGVGAIDPQPDESDVLTFLQK